MTGKHAARNSFIQTILLSRGRCISADHAARRSSPGIAIAIINDVITTWTICLVSSSLGLDASSCTRPRKPYVAKIGETRMPASRARPHRAEIRGSDDSIEAASSIVEAVAQRLHHGAKDYLRARMRASELICDVGDA